MKKTSHKLAAALTAGMMVASADAHANNFSTVATNIKASSAQLPELISIVAYISGIGFAVVGIFKLKQHVDNPGQVLMKDGLIRLGAGGALLALPFLLDAMTNTVGTGGTAPVYNQFTGIGAG